MKGRRFRADLYHRIHVLRLRIPPLRQRAEDIRGLTENPPRFVLRYADLRTEIRSAVTRFADDVRDGVFPSTEETYPSPVGFAEEIHERLGC